MIKVIGVRFRRAGKVYYFNPLDMDITTGMHVIVETARGVEYGYVVLGVKDMDEEKVFQPLKPVIRIATPQDDAVADENRQKEKDAFKICQEKIAKHGLDMKLIDAEYTFDNNKVLFYFTADGRVDFRELVKDLASVFRTRIELRQIGVRDEAKIIGGIGSCGRPLCCNSYLSEFAPVSIKMAKEQNLSLNPVKISGVCGRLMCCLKNEEETYEYLNSKLPSVGDYVTTDDGLKGEVSSVSVLRQEVKVIVTVNKDEKEIREYKVSQLKFRPHKRREKTQLSDKELKELEDLDRLDKTAASHFTGLEIQEEVAKMASRSVMLNHLGDKVSIICGDLKNTKTLFGKGVFNVVTVNPPYMAGGSGLVGADYSKAVSRHEILCSLEDVIRESANVLVAGGRMYMVHRPYRLGDIICLMKQYKMSPRRLCMVHPKASQEANLVLIEGIRGGNTQIRVEAPLVLFDEDGQESKQIKMIHGRL